jgi:hypothetical protein
VPRFDFLLRCSKAKFRRGVSAGVRPFQGEPTGRRRMLVEFECRIDRAVAESGGERGLRGASGRGVAGDRVKRCPKRNKGPSLLVVGDRENREGVIRVDLRMRNGKAALSLKRAIRLSA